MAVTARCRLQSIGVKPEEEEEEEEVAGRGDAANLMNYLFPKKHFSSVVKGLKAMFCEILIKLTYKCSNTCFSQNLVKLEKIIFLSSP